MKTNMLRGWKDICDFTYRQTMKGKAMKISIIIICVIILLVKPVTSFISQQSEEGIDFTKIEKAYVYDETELIGKELSKLSSDIYGDIEYIEKDIKDDTFNKDEFIKDNIENSNENVVLLYIGYKNSNIDITVYYGNGSEIEKNDAKNLGYFVKGNIKKAILFSSGVSEEKADRIVGDTEYDIEVITDYIGEDNGSQSLTGTEYGFAYGLILILIMFISISGSKVAELIVTEKSSKVIEYILTSVKPMAILVGKIISSLLIVFTMAVFALVSFLGSIVIDESIFEKNGGDIIKALTSSFDFSILNGLNPLNIILSIIILCIGLVFFGLLGGIAGASVSKVEEMAEGMKIYTFSLLIGAYLSMGYIIFLSTGEHNVGIFEHIVYLMPLSSVFIVPQFLLIGKIAVWESLLSIFILMITVIILAYFVNKVYEHMLYNNGAPLKIKNIIALAKEKKGDENE